MFSDAQRNEILATALRAAEAKASVGASLGDVVNAAVCIIAAAKAIEVDVGTGGSILDRARREDNERAKRAD
jgi:hypothetical protein